MNLSWFCSFVILGKLVDGWHLNSTDETLVVDLTLIRGAAEKGAVCLDGSLPGYHLHRGHGSGAKSWVIHLEGGSWCYTTQDCIVRSKGERGSSKHMKPVNFTGILSNKYEENPDFFNWNRVMLRYCDGASFSGDRQDKASGLHFRGQRIWLAAVEVLMSKGMRHAKQALLTGCSAGGLASILHCDKFRKLIPHTATVKCMSDAGFFLDVIDISGGRFLRDLFKSVVSLQGVQKNLPHSCTAKKNPTSCFFPSNLIAHIKTPLFILNSAYDAWQVNTTLLPASADPHGKWKDCRSHYANCSVSQILILEDFRNQMFNAVKRFSRSKKNGLFMNSCFAHCQTDAQDPQFNWFSPNSPRIGNKNIAGSVGDWYFDRARTNVHIDHPYPFGINCHNKVFKSFVPDLPI